MTLNITKPISRGEKRQKKMWANIRTANVATTNKESQVNPVSRCVSFGGIVKLSIEVSREAKMQGKTRQNKVEVKIKKGKQSKES